MLSGKTRAVLSQGRPRDAAVNFDTFSPTADEITANIRTYQYLIFLESKIIGLHFAADSMGLSSFISFCWSQ